MCSGLMPTFTDIKDLIVNGVSLKQNEMLSVDREENQALAAS